MNTSELINSIPFQVAKDYFANIMLSSRSHSSSVTFR